MNPSKYHADTFFLFHGLFDCEMHKYGLIFLRYRFPKIRDRQGKKLPNNNLLKCVSMEELVTHLAMEQDNIEPLSLQTEHVAITQ